MDRKELNKLDYVLKKTIVNKNNMEEYAFYDTRRKLRKTQVNNLKKALREGGTFPPVAVNIKNNKKYVLDGNHRFEALKEYLVESDKNVEIWEIQFHMEDLEKEKDVFMKLNNGVSVSSDDVICMFQDEPFLQDIMKKCSNVSVYGSEKKPVKLRPLLAAYFLAITKRHQTDFMSSETLLAKIKNAGKHDVNTICAFLRDYEVIFGSMMTKSNIWLRTTLITAMFRIWYQNKETIPFDNMLSRFRILINHPYTLEFAKLGGKEASYICAQRFVDILNSKRGKPFVLATDENRSASSILKDMPILVN